MPTINTADLFNKDAFSDLTLTYGTRHFHAHQLVLATQSDYFRKLCSPAPNALLSESAGRKTIKLEGDAEDAVEAMLRWIYTFEYDAGPLRFTAEAFTWHYEVWATAEKYGLPKLANLARGRVEVLGSRCGVDVLVQILGMGRGEEGERCYREFVLELLFRDDAFSLRRLRGLLRDEGFLRFVGGDGEVGVRVIRVLRDGV
ncbi:hypothetical protein LTR08_003913 [Meristemomyces frigidus]|nr:hypothetical protein LTR08_003913 [Meristemomyces frigidus]